MAGAGREGVNDPLRFAFDEDMEDLTAQLESSLASGRGGRNSPGLDLGDNVQLQGNQDRFKPMAHAQQDDDDPLSSLMGVGVGTPLAPAACRTSSTTSTSSSSTRTTPRTASWPRTATARRRRTRTRSCTTRWPPGPAAAGAAAAAVRSTP